MGIHDFSCFFCSHEGEQHITIWSKIVTEEPWKMDSPYEGVNYGGNAFVYFYENYHNPINSGTRHSGVWKREKYNESNFKRDLGYFDNRGERGWDSIFKIETSETEAETSEETEPRSERIGRRRKSGKENWALIACKECYEAFIADETEAVGPQMMRVLRKFWLIPFLEFEKQQYGSADLPNKSIEKFISDRKNGIPQLIPIERNDKREYESILSQVGMNPTYLQDYLVAFAGWLGLRKPRKFRFCSPFTGLNPLVPFLIKQMKSYDLETYNFDAVGWDGKRYTTPEVQIRENLEPRKLEIMLSSGWKPQELARVIWKEYNALAEDYYDDDLLLEQEELDRLETLALNKDDVNWLKEQEDDFFHPEDLEKAAFKGDEALYRRLRQIFPKSESFEMGKAVQKIYLKRYDPVGQRKRVELLLDYGGNPNSKYADDREAGSILKWSINVLKDSELAKILLRAGAKPENKLVGMIKDPELNSLLAKE